MTLYMALIHGEFVRNFVSRGKINLDVVFEAPGNLPVSYHVTGNLPVCYPSNVTDILRVIYQQLQQ
jgi:hypothetical protein